MNASSNSRCVWVDEFSQTAETTLHISNLFAAALANEITLVVDPEKKLRNSLSNLDLNLPKDIALLLPSSGISGSAKFVGLTSRALLASATASLKFLGAATTDNWSLLLPLTHIAGFNVLTRANISGRKIISDIAESAEFSAIVPTQLHRALFPKSERDQYLQKHLLGCRSVLVGGAATSESLQIKAAELGINLTLTYGSSETSGGCIYQGYPLGGVEYRINSNGIIEIAGDTLASGYWENNNFNQAPFASGWYQSNDLGEIENGKLKVIGRADDVIISGGEKISLSQLEKLLIEHFPEHEFLAGKIDSAEWGESLVLLHTGEVSEWEILSLIDQHFPKYYRPKQIKEVFQLPVRSIGKPDRSALGQYFSI